MPSPRKRPFVPDDDEQAARKAMRVGQTQDDTLDVITFDGSSVNPQASPTPYIDLTQDDDEPMEDAPPIQMPDSPPSIRLDLIGEDDATEPVAIADTSVATTPDAQRLSPAAQSAISSADARSIDESPIAAYDVCFGLLCVQGNAMTGVAVPSECTRATVSFDGKVLRVYLADQDDHVAIFMSSALSRLVSQYAVTLTATICGKKSKSLETWDMNRPGSGNPFGFKRCNLRIIVYGFRLQGDAVANLLAEDGLYLQHPSPAEIDAGARYENPQYFLPPDEEMPPLDKLSVSICCVPGASSSRNLLRIYERNQILRLFDTAYEPGAERNMVEPSSRLKTELKSHQIEALTMMVEKEAGVYERAQFPAIWKLFRSPTGQVRYQNIVTRKFQTPCPPPMGGGILADEMGLGKTLSSLALICYSLDCIDSSPEISKALPRGTLIVTPKSTIYGWEKQLETHILPGKVRWMTYHGSRRHEVSEGVTKSDVVLTTYDTLRSDQVKGSPLFSQEWERIILDEAHKIRNRNSKIFRCVREVRANYHWCLTGTPIQNSLDDFGALLAFTEIPPFNTDDAFGKNALGSMMSDKKKGLELLRQVVAATCLRRTKAEHSLALNLPLKTEVTEKVEMSPEDRQVYNFFKRSSYLTATEGKSGTNMTNNILVLIAMLRLICDHGEALLPAPALRAWADRDLSLLTFKMLESEVRKCISCDQDIEEIEDAVSAVEELPCGHAVCESCMAKSQLQLSDSQPACPKCGPSGQRSPSALSSPSPPTSQSASALPLTPQSQPSAKLQALLRNLEAGRAGPGDELGPHKSVVFSYWTKMLDRIEAALKRKGIGFCRIDGQRTLNQRKNALETFDSDPECNIMLASLGAAGEGIDLTAASTVHIVEPHWNPMAEAQAIDRIHRIGQQRDVKVIRYITNKSIEEYVQWVQWDKLRLIKQTLSRSGQDVEKVVEVRLKKLLEFLS